MKHVDSNGVKTKILFCILVTLLSGMAVADDADQLEKVIAKLNRDAKEEGGHKSVLEKISDNTGVPVATLEAQMKRTQLGYGEVYAANSIARGAGTTFDHIAGLKAEGKNWRQIVRDSRVSMVRGRAKPDKASTEEGKSKTKSE